MRSIVAETETLTPDIVENDTTSDAVYSEHIAKNVLIGFNPMKTKLEWKVVEK